MNNKVSPEGQDLWDWASRFSDQVHTLDKISKLTKQNSDIKNVCGSCKLWMTSACPREKHNNRTGRKQGPSAMDIKCGKFEMSSFSAKIADEIEVEISNLSIKLQGIKN